MRDERIEETANTRSLQEVIALYKRKRLLDPIGNLEWNERYDYKAERSRDDA
jgi:hypothetical protein